MKRSAPLALAGLFALTLVGCGDRESDATGDAATAAAADDPVAVVEQAAEHLKANRLDAVVELAVPPKRLEQMRQRWVAERDANPPDAEEAAEFEKTMAKLTGDDAEQVLMAEVEPHLAKYDAEVAPQLPMMIGMGRGFAVQAIQENKEFPEERKQELIDTLDAIAKWLGQAKFSDREAARQAISRVVEGARELELATVDQVQQLDFDQMLDKAGVGFAAAKDVVGYYGLDLDATFDSMDASLVKQEGDSATVKVDYQLFGEALSFQTEMVRVDGRWYGRDTIEQLERELRDVEQAAEEDAAETAPN